MTPHSERNDSSNARSLVRNKITKFVLSYPITRAVQEDLSQEILLKLHRVALSCQPNAGKGNAYLNKVIDRCLIDFLRRICAARRDYRRRDSIHRLVREDNGTVVELGSTLSEDAHQFRLRHAPRSDQERIEAVLDLETMLSWLPPELRELAHRLLDQSPTEIARETGVAVTTIQYRVERIRNLFRRRLQGK